MRKKQVESVLEGMSNSLSEVGRHGGSYRITKRLWGEHCLSPRHGAPLGGVQALREASRSLFLRVGEPRARLALEQLRCSPLTLLSPDSFGLSWA